MSEKWEILAENYDDKDWPFSSAKAWEKVVNKNPTEFNKLQYVEQLRLSGKYSKAEEVIQSVEIDKIPKPYKFLLYVRKGMLCVDQGELSEAINNFRKSIEYQPEETYPYVFLAAALSKKGKLDEVELVLEKGLLKEGDIDEVNYNLSLNYARKGNFKEAIKRMKKCLDLDPNFENAKTWLRDFEQMENDSVK